MDDKTPQVKLDEEMLAGRRSKVSRRLEVTGVLIMFLDVMRGTAGHEIRELEGTNKEQKATHVEREIKYLHLP